MISTMIGDDIVTVGDKVSYTNENLTMVGEILSVNETDDHDILLVIELKDKAIFTLNAKDCRLYKGE